MAYSKCLVNVSHGNDGGGKDDNFRENVSFAISVVSLLTSFERVPLYKQIMGRSLLVEAYMGDS